MTKTNQIAFTKMHGLGNDFVVINALSNTIDVSRLPIEQLANRHLGIGFDQLLLLEPATHATAFCRIFNADGSEAEQCGNGLRCVARFLHEEKIATKTLQLATKAGMFPVEIEDYDHISVMMGTPLIQEKLIELKTADLNNIMLTVVSMGNPHAIIKVNTLDNLPIDALSSLIATHELFPEGVNIGFLEVLNQNQARLRTIERGIGETQACGSNACAAACAGIINGWLDKQVHIKQALGTLTITWKGEHHPLYMTGPAERVFEGYVAFETLKAS